MPEAGSPAIGPGKTRFPRNVIGRGTLSDPAGHSTNAAGAATLPAEPTADAGGAYRKQMAHVLYQLHCAFPMLGGDERLEIYNEVWARLLERRGAGFWPDDLR